MLSNPVSPTTFNSGGETNEISRKKNSEAIKMLNWRNSVQKATLKNDIVEGRVTDEMDALVVYNMHNGTYHEFAFAKFRSNLRNLRLAIEKLRRRSRQDEIVRVNTMAKKPIIQHATPQLMWYSSEARRLLQIDMTSGATEGKKPAEIHGSRPEYMEFPLKKLRDNMYKERHQPAARAYWLHQKEQRKMRR